MIGQTIRHFHIQDELGHGGMARVYRAWDSILDRHVAIKVLSSPAPAGSPETAAAREHEQVLREARAASRIEHPNIAPVYEVFTHESRSYLVMQLIDGPSLRARLEKGPLPIDEATWIAVSMARGLDEAHRHGVLHRDIKPENRAEPLSGRP